MTSYSNTESIEHEGIVQDSGGDSVRVRITSASACCGCHAESSCTLSGKKEKIVDVAGLYNVSPGDKVTVVMKLSAGHAALILGYILPLFVILVTLTGLISASVPELAAGLSAVAVLLPYYFILWLFRKRISKKFTFTIKS